MDIQAIRTKYKSILNQTLPSKSSTKPDFTHQSNQEEQSQRQWINIVKQQKQKRILTQSTNNHINRPQSVKQNKKTSTIKKSSMKLSTQQTIINLKQKLAQSILNFSRQESEIKQFEQLLLKKNQEIKNQNKQINELKNIINQKDQQILDEKIKFDAMQKFLKDKDNTIQQCKIQNSLLKKYIQQYSNEVQTLNLKLKDSKKQYQHLQKDLSKKQFFKSKIQKLKDDIKRLQFLLSDNQVYAPLLISLQGKHFLGKPSKQSKQLQYWYPQSLINGVQKFLKKEQVGYGNKIFSENLSKFIYGLVERSQKNGQKKQKSKYSSRIKQIQRKKNHIVNTFDMGFEEQSKRKTCRQSHLQTTSLRKTTPLNGNSYLKSRDFSICLQKSLCLQRKNLRQAENNRHHSQIEQKRWYTLNSIDDQRKTLGKKLKVFENDKLFENPIQQKKRQFILELIQYFYENLTKILKLSNKVLSEQKFSQLCEQMKNKVRDYLNDSPRELQ